MDGRWSLVTPPTSTATGHARRKAWTGRARIGVFRQVRAKEAEDYTKELKASM